MTIADFLEVFDYCGGLTIPLMSMRAFETDNEDDFINITNKPGKSEPCWALPIWKFEEQSVGSGFVEKYIKGLEIEKLVIRSKSDIIFFIDNDTYDEIKIDL